MSRRPPPASRCRRPLLSTLRGLPPPVPTRPSGVPKGAGEGPRRVPTRPPQGLTRRTPGGQQQRRKRVVPVMVGPQEHVTIATAHPVHHQWHPSSQSDDASGPNPPPRHVSGQRQGAPHDAVREVDTKADGAESVDSQPRWNGEEIASCSPRLWLRSGAYRVFTRKRVFLSNSSETPSERSPARTSSTSARTVEEMRPDPHAGAKKISCCQEPHGANRHDSLGSPYPMVNQCRLCHRPCGCCWPASEPADCGEIVCADGVSDMIVL